MLLDSDPSAREPHRGTIYRLKVKFLRLWVGLIKKKFAVEAEFGISPALLLIMPKKEVYRHIAFLTKSFFEICGKFLKCGKFFKASFLVKGAVSTYVL